MKPEASDGELFYIQGKLSLYHWVARLEHTVAESRKLVRGDEHWTDYFCLYGNGFFPWVGVGRWR